MIMTDAQIRALTEEYEDEWVRCIVCPGGRPGGQVLV